MLSPSIDTDNNFAHGPMRTVASGAAWGNANRDAPSGPDSLIGAQSLFERKNAVYGCLDDSYTSHFVLKWYMKVGDKHTRGKIFSGFLQLRILPQ
jgi:hypothetical protein